MSSLVKKGKFISIEGIDGGGKTTQIKFIEDKIRELGLPTLLTREPGSSPVSEQIRSIVLSTDTKISDKTELFLYLSARAELVESVINPALNSGKWVITDRFYDSTFAYQGFGRGLDIKEMKMANRVATGGLTPDITILLDISVKDGKSRASNRGEADRLEQNSLDFFEKVRNGFLTLAKDEPNRFIVVDASQDIDSVKSDILKELVDRNFFSVN